MRTTITILTTLAIILCASMLRAASLPPGFTESSYGGNLGSSPTAMDFAPDGRLFICLQGGDLRVVNAGTLLPTPFVTVPTSANGERGLLGVAFDPDFANNQYVYVYYTASIPQTHNRVSRFTANGNVAAAGETPILDLENLSGATNHNGGAIHFGPDGKLYIAVGENANASNSQSINTRLGKMLRINADGSIPADNPTTISGIGSPTGANRAIWAAGLRNPFTFGFQPGTGRLFINDVGETTWEEINDGIAGSNYGWNICEGFCSPPNSNLRDPLFRYGHGGGPTVGCAIVGGGFYNPANNQFPASYIGTYFFGDLCSGWIRSFDPTTSTATDFASGIATPVDLKVGTQGSLYYLTQGNAGQVLRVSSTSPSPAPIAISGTVSYCTNPNPGPVANVTLTMVGLSAGTNQSDGSGGYIFSNLPFGGSFGVTPSKAALPPGSPGITTVDVIATQGYFLNNFELTGCALAAADVNADAAVNTIDVIAVQKFFLGSSSGIADVGKFQFTPARRIYTGATTPQTSQNYNVIVFGDVAPPFAQ